MYLSTHPTSYPARYQEIAARLEQELRQHYRCGDYPPAKHQLTARHEVNRHTLRRAIDQLIGRGWAQRCQGVDVLVLIRPSSYPPDVRARLSQNLLDQGSHPTSKELLAVLRPASSHIVDALDINEGDNMTHLRTLHRVNGITLCQVDRYFSSLSLWPLLQGFNSGSLHDYLCEQPGLTLPHTQTRIGIHRAQARGSKILKIPNMAPLLCIRILDHRGGGEHAAKYSVSLTRTGMIEFAMEYRMHFDTATRQHWMRVPAYGNADALNTRITTLRLTPDYGLIRAPESGLMWVQAHTGGTGNHLFTSGTTLARAVICLKSDTLGYNYLLERNKRHAEQCAMIGVLLQEQTHFQNLMEILITPLEAEHDALINARHAEVNASRVDFFVLVREDNA